MPFASRPAIGRNCGADDALQLFDLSADRLSRPLAARAVAVGQALSTGGRCEPVGDRDVGRDHEGRHIKYETNGHQRRGVGQNKIVASPTLASSKSHVHCRSVR